MLGPDHAVRFTCLPTCWGRCCSKMDLPLYPWDVVTLARGLGVSTARVLAEHVLVTAETQTGWPGVRLKEIRSGPCAFLNRADGTCTVYAHRPDVCRLYPLGREWPAEGNDFTYRWSDRPRCPQGALAPDCRERTVAQWLDEEVSPAATAALQDYFRLQRRALVDYGYPAWSGPDRIRPLAALLYDQDRVRQQAGAGPDVSDPEMHRRCVAAADLLLRTMARAAGAWRGPAADDLAAELTQILRGETP